MVLICLICLFCVVFIIYHLYLLAYSSMTNRCNSIILNLNEHSSNYPKFFKDVYDKNCLNKKKIYINWIDKISKKYEHNIFWWSLGHVNKNNYLNNIFHYFVILETLNQLRNSKKFDCLIIDDIIQNNIEKIKFRYKKKIIYKKTKKRKRNFFQIFKFFIYEFLSILTLKLFKKDYPKKKKFELIDCFITDHNNYQTSIMKKIKKSFCNKNGVFVPTYAYIGYFQRLLLNIKLVKRNDYIIKEQFLNFFDLLKLFQILIFPFLHNKKFSTILKWDFDKIVRSEMFNFSQYESILTSTLNYYFVKRIHDESLNVCKAINYFENQNIDKGWNLGFKIFYNQEICFGYQAFNYLPEAFNTSPSKLEYVSGVCPKNIILKGKGFKKIISENCKEFKFLIGSSFKKFKLFNNKKKIDYLFIFTGIPDEDKKLIENVLLFKKTVTKKKIGVKFHPISKVSRQTLKLLSNEKIQIFDGNINRFIILSDFVVSTGLSTSLLEALISNCKIILLSNSPYDKFFFKNLNIPQKSYIFLNDTSKIKNLKLFRLNKNEKRKIISNYF